MTNQRKKNRDYIPKKQGNKTPEKLSHTIPITDKKGVISHWRQCTKKVWMQWMKLLEGNKLW